MVNMQAMLKEVKCIPNCHHSTKGLITDCKINTMQFFFYSYQDYLTLYSAEKKFKNLKQEVKFLHFC